MERDNSYLIGNQFAKGSEPNKTAFKKGARPWNKDKKGMHLSPKTEFKKGQRSVNFLPVGTKRLRKEKNNGYRRFIKIEDPNVWIEYAKLVWIQSNGKIPKGYLIHHIDEDKLNDTISNLALVTRAAHINLHRHVLAEGKQRKASQNKEAQEQQQ